MSDLAFNVWGAIAAVIGTIALVPTFLIWLRTCFPSALLPSLIDTFDKAEVSFKRAVADGVFTNEEEQNQYDVTLGSAYTQILDIQSQVKSRAFRQNAKNWWNGLSGQIVTLCEELTSFQAKLAEKSSKERKRLASESSVADMPLLSNRKGTHNRSSSALHALSGADSCSPELEKNMHSSLGLDRAAGNGSYGFSGQKSEQPTHHLISDTDLQSLLSVALSSSTGDEDIEGQLAARPSEVLLDFEKRLLDSSENDLGPKRSRLGALSRVVKRIYGIRLHGHGKDKGVHHRRPQRLRRLQEVSRRLTVSLRSSSTPPVSWYGPRPSSPLLQPSHSLACSPLPCLRMWRCRRHTLTCCDASKSLDNSGEHATNAAACRQSTACI